MLIIICPLNKIKVITILVLALLNFTNIYAQRKFNASASFGSNISQIDGDKLAGFNKLGIMGGISVKYQLYKNLNLSTEFLYSNRGASSSIIYNKNNDIHITLNYVDIPITLELSDWYDEEKSFYRVFGKTGLQYSRLINSSTNFSKYLIPIETISNFDLSYLIGFGYNLTQKIGIEARYNRSLRRIQKELIEDIGNFKVYYWSFRINYNI